MTAAALFAVGGTAIAALCLLLSLAIVARRGLRERAHRRARALAEPHRQLLVALVVDDDVDQAHLATLLRLDAATWAALEPVVVSMVRKLRGEAREVLVDLLDRRGTIARLTRRLSSRGAVRRARSAELLGLLGEHAPRAELERLLVRDHDPEVRIVAARALGEIGDPASAPALLSAVSGPHAVPMRIVARSLARLGPGAATALVEAMTSAEAPARAVAAEILGLGGAVTAVGVLSSHALRDPDDDVRIRCARALGRIGVPSALSVLRRCVEPEEPAALRAVAARAVGDVGGAEAVRLLRPLLADVEHRVASNAARSLAGLGLVGLAVLHEVVDADEPGATYAAEALAVHDLARPRVDSVQAPGPTPVRSSS
ncbi:MAG TPA: HEAT repeat domain-containing protein [Angustibacter sp.]|nr:HEAT repeat domain-containing protein [Angustibacter sp.]